MKNLFKVLGVAVLMAVIAFSIIACDNGSTSGDGDPVDPDTATYTGYDSEGKLYSLAITKGSPTTTVSGDKDSRLVTASTQAWIDNYDVGERDGWLFNSDGVVNVIDDYTGTTSGTFKVQGSGTWTTSGDNSLTVIGGNGVSETYSYTVSGNTLTLTRGGDSQVYTKTTVTVTGRSALSPSPAGPPTGNTGTKAVSAIKGAALSPDRAGASPASRAAYAPQSGDKFTLTIKNGDGTTAGTSKGMISDIKNDAAEDTYTLEHDDGEKFTAKLKGAAIAEIPDAIPLDDGGKLDAPGTLTTTKPAGGGPAIQLPSNATTLTENRWADCNLPTTNSVQWYTFTATASTQYIHSNVSNLLYIQFYNSSGAQLGDHHGYNGTYGRLTKNGLTPGQTYYFSAMVGHEIYTGNYLIGFSASEERPFHLPANPVPLTANQWADGSIPESGTREQWFTFTATSSTQWIHIEFGTLTQLYVNVYTGSGPNVGSTTLLESTNRHVLRPLASGQTYYIRVRPRSSSYSGTYRIMFNATPPGNNLIALTANQWADGNLPTSDDEQWFTFTATASTQWIHFDFESGTLTNLYMQVFDSGGATSGNETSLWSYTKSASRTLTAGQTYYIRVRPYSSNNSGTYRIGFNTTPNPPGTTSTTLTANQWADGNLPTGASQQWFTFTATASTQWIHFEPGTLSSLDVLVYNSIGVGSDRTELSYSSRSTSRSLTSGQTYYIMVTPTYSTGGTYKIAFNTSTTAPPMQLPSNASPLTANQWADGNLPTSSDVQWFTFTATSSTQYIHFDYTGTLKDVSVQVYDSSSKEVGSEARLSYTNYIQRPLESGQTYYIRVRPYSSSYSGTYRIGFNAAIAPPGAITLTENQWADGDIATAGVQQWFTFTATTSAVNGQYIHVSFGTLTDLYVQVYDSSGATVVYQTNIYSSSTNSSKYISPTLASGQTYYIRVRPYSSSGSGTYRIAFNGSSTAPTQ